PGAGFGLGRAARSPPGASPLLRPAPASRPPRGTRHGPGGGSPPTIFQVPDRLLAPETPDRKLVLAGGPCQPQRLRRVRARPQARPAIGPSPCLCLVRPTVRFRDTSDTPVASSACPERRGRLGKLPEPPSEGLPGVPSLLPRFAPSRQSAVAVRTCRR